MTLLFSVGGFGTVGPESVCRISGIDVQSKLLGDSAVSRLLYKLHMRQEVA